MEEEFRLDPETEFIAKKQEKTGNEWELFKENVRPLKRGRNVLLLNRALKSHSDSLLFTRRKLIEAIDDYQGEDPLLPWLQCIKWVQEAFPSGGDSSGLIVIYEQCVRAFWHSDQYKDDLRYLKVWLEYAENCVDAEVIFSFLDANGIGKSHSIFYIAYALHMESKCKSKIANDIFNLGISRDAKPTEKLKDAYKKFVTRTMRRPLPVKDDSTDGHLPSRSFGTVLANAGNRSQNAEHLEATNKATKPDRAQKTPLGIYKDTNVDKLLGHQPGQSKIDLDPWTSLGTRAERNKENNALPTKWTTYKVPSRPTARSGGPAPSACIEVFVDEEYAEYEKSRGRSDKSSGLQLRQGDNKDLKRETELLRENPLRNFPLNGLPR